MLITAALMTGAKLNLDEDEIRSLLLIELLEALEMTADIIVQTD